jgi:hypothetical protein
VKSTPKVTGFVGGTANKPTPISEKEVEKIMQQMQEGVEKPRPRCCSRSARMVRVKEGPFTDFNGNVEEVNYEKSKLRVSVTIFGRATPVELEFRPGREGLTGRRIGRPRGLPARRRTGRRRRGAQVAPLVRGALHSHQEPSWQRRSSATSSCRCRQARPIPRRRSVRRSASAA